MVSIFSRRTTDIREVGFNDSVRLGDGSFHVQTEVLDRGNGDAEVRSTVLDGGMVVHTVSVKLAQTGDFEEARSQVKAQHDEVVQRVSSGDLT